MATFNLERNQQFNIETAGPHTFNFPAGADGANPVGVRNLFSSQVDVTFVAEAGEGFWNTETQTADNSVTDSIWGNTSRMFVFRAGKGWVIQDADTVIGELVAAGYGWAEQNTDIPLEIPAVGWVTLPLQTQHPAGEYVPRGVAFDTVNDTFQLVQKGIWQMSIVFNLVGHNSVNAGRAFVIQLYDVTLGVSIGNGVTIGVGRNVEESNNRNQRRPRLRRQSGPYSQRGRR